MSRYIAFARNPRTGEDYHVVGESNVLEEAKKAVRREVAKIGLRCLFKWDGCEYRCGEGPEHLYGYITDAKAAKEQDAGQLQEVAKRLKFARESAGLTVKQAAKVLNLPVNYIETLEESGNPTALRIIRICEVYGVSPTWLLTGSNPGFNAQEWLEKAQASGMSFKDAEKLAALLESLDG